MTMPPATPPSNKNSAMKTVLIVGAIILACALLCCCGGAFGLGWWGKNTAKKLSSGEKFSIGGVNFNTELPADIPAYPGATKSMSLGKAEGTLFTFETNDASSKVHSFYLGKLPAEGWKLSHSESNASAIQDYYRKGQRSLVISATAASPTTVSLLETKNDTSEPSTEPQSPTTIPATEP